jgi:hypothetical protein
MAVINDVGQLLARRQSMSDNRWKRLRTAARAAVGLVAVTTTLAGATSASAAVPNRLAFVLWNGVSAVPASTRPAGTMVIPGSPGRYTVIFPGQAASGGVVHVTAVNGSPHWCQAEGCGPLGIDEVVHLRCYQAGGLLSMSKFTVFFTSSSSAAVASAGRYGYVDVLPTGTIISQFNSAGPANSVIHGFIGRWLVKLPGLGTPGPRAGSLQATAVNSTIGARCKVVNWASNLSDQQAKVFCFDSGGRPFDTRFTLSHQYHRSLYGATPPKPFGYLWNQPPPGPPATNFNSVLGPGANTLAPAGTGLSTVTFKGIGVQPDTVQVTAFGEGSQFCGLNAPWSVGAGDAVVHDVNCFSNAGVPLNTGFLISYNAARHV